ncbi:MAG: sodium:solute symporter [Cytophagales bacterium]|uniref:sodium:solute symporter n=1 Tax=Cyclobacterium marinum TaxID=104 RepID=UPI0011ED2994|nr:sodium:solute symporter [Cyclobacterium marinum]MBI0398867.1 sodium:solute symporter [Cyclobacterium marinum]MBR9774209.1 sodium:solute symporter [Cytophagales bacterium]|tara:strand:- start:62275 stop:63756 length:1482 start_codon:yes stop_codon:yes gene_type:complete
MDLSLIDLVVFLSYMLAIILFGASFYFKKRSANDYITGGGRLPSWAIGMSIFATFVSSISFLALPGSAYLSNWSGFVFSLSIPIAAILAVKFFVPLYRGIKNPSAYYYLETKFGAWARTYASICYLLTQLARMGAIMYLLALPMNVMFGWSIPMIIVVTGVSVLIYSIMGGFEAVIWTDAIQGIVLISGALACLLIIMFSMPEGPGQVFTIGAEHDKFSLGSLGFSLSESTFWVILIYGLFINLQNFGVDQNYVQRYLSAKSDKEAVKSTLLGSLLYVPVSLLFFFIGTALFAYYQAMPELLPEAYSGMDQADKVFPYFIVSGLPVGMTGLLIASIFAAGMSTISTSINSSATIILTDHYKRYISPDVSGKSEMRVLLFSSFIMGLLAIIVAIAFNGVESALDAWWALSAIFSGGILGLFLLGFIGKNIKQKYAAIGVALGVLVIAWMSLSPVILEEGMRFRSTFHANLTIVFGTIVIFLVGFLFSAIANRKN